MVKKGSVLVTDHSFADLNEEESVFRDAGIALAVADCADEDDVIASTGPDVRALIVQWAPIGRKVLEARPEIGLVVRYGIGLDNIDLAAASELGVAVANVPDYCIEEVAEHAVALMLATQRRLTEFDRLVRGDEWAVAAGLRGPSSAISRQTVGVVGLGRIGRRVAGILQGFGATVRVYDPLAVASDLEGTGLTTVASPADLAGCDAVTLHCPLTADTQGLVDEGFLGELREGAILVNTSRGQLVQTDALVAALDSGHLGGAGLDTFDPEPLPADHPLLNHPNVIATPHVAWLSVSARRSLQREAALEAARFIAGEPLRSAQP